MKTQILHLACGLILSTSLFMVIDIKKEKPNTDDLASYFDFGYLLNTGSGTGSGCPPNYTGPNQLAGLQIVGSHFETPGIITSDQIIQGSITVDYDSGTSIELLPGFEVVQGVTFHAFIDGCTPTTR